MKKFWELNNNMINNSLIGNLFARGFLITQGKPNYIPENWDEHEFKHWTIAIDPRVNFTHFQMNDVTSIVIGDAVDATESMAHNEVSNVLSDTFLNDNYQDFVDGLCGRYVLISISDTLRIQQDAAGLRSVFFSRTESAAGSHPALVAKQLDEKPSVFSRRYLSKHGYTCMPGRSTEFDDVFALTPNTELDLETGQARRIYAGDLSGSVSVEDAAQSLIETAANQLPWLAGRGPTISLSAGLDSRSSLALLKPIAESLTAFTYTSKYHKKNRYSKHDLNIAIKLSSLGNIPIEVIDIDKIILDAGMKQILEVNFYKHHAQKLAQKYMTSLEGRVNIRSNVFGIARATYESKEFLKLGPEEMVTLAYGGKVTDSLAVESFQDFIDETDFPSQSDMDLRDLFLWEHRIGVWQAAIYLESDVSHQSHVLLNQRAILKKLLSVPKYDRIHGSVFKLIIRQQWPELSKYPVNGVPF